MPEQTKIKTAYNFFLIAYDLTCVMGILTWYGSTTPVKSFLSLSFRQYLQAG